MKKIICAIMIIGIILTGCQKKVETKTETVLADTTQRTYIESFVTYLNNGDMTALLKEFTYDKAMQTVIDSGSFEKQFTAILEQTGALQAYEDAYTISSENKMVLILPCIFENTRKNIQITLQEDMTIIGVFLMPYQEYENTPIPSDVKEEVHSIDIGNGMQNRGKLTTPIKGDDFPIVILVSGSGPNDMDSTISNNKPFRDIAWSLAQQGIATYRFDKRTYGNAASFTKDSTIKEEYIDDICTAIDLLKETEQINSKQIYVLGHSEGGYILPRLAKETNDIAGYIFMSAPARPLEDLIIEQITYISNLDGVIDEEEQMLIEQYKKDQTAVKAIQDTTEHQMYFNSLSTAYLLDLKDYDPVEEAKKINVPVMLAQGTNDYQVTMKDYALWEQAFASNANWSLHTYACNHIMMEGKQPSTPEDYAEKGMVDIAFINDIVSFILE